MEFVINGFKFVWDIIEKNIHYCAVENRNLFRDNLIERAKIVN